MNDKQCKVNSGDLKLNCGLVCPNRHNSVLSRFTHGFITICSRFRQFLREGSYTLHGFDDIYIILDDIFKFQSHPFFSLSVIDDASCQQLYTLLAHILALGEKQQKKITEIKNNCTSSD